MLSTSYSLHGTQVLECAPDGEKLEGERDAIELIGEAAQQRATLVLIPAERLADDFFKLRTRIAGDIVLKFVTYRLRLAIVGDISRHLSESSALRDFVVEANRGPHVWFVADRAELETRLKRDAGSCARILGAPRLPGAADPGAGITVGWQRQEHAPSFVREGAA